MAEEESSEANNMQLAAIPLLSERSEGTDET
jgi:hypothetical protein